MLSVFAAAYNPRLQLCDLVRRKIPARIQRRHPVVLVSGFDASQQCAFFRMPGNDCRPVIKRRKCAFLRVQSQPLAAILSAFAFCCIGPVTLKTASGKDGADLPLEIRHLSRRHSRPQQPGSKERGTSTKGDLETRDHRHAGSLGFTNRLSKLNLMI